MKIKTWRIEEENGYKPQFTFYEDFSIADHFGISAVKSTYTSAFNEWKDDYQALTELCLALNWKIREHYKEHPDKEKIGSITTKQQISNYRPGKENPVNKPLL